MYLQHLLFEGDSFVGKTLAQIASAICYGISSALFPDISGAWQHSEQVRSCKRYVWCSLI
jgi:hypothetical protein